MNKMINITTNNNSPSSVSDEMEKAINDNILFNVHHCAVE